MSAPSSTRNEKAALLSAEGVTKSYPGGTIALDGVDLRLSPGEIVGLIGANGSGKTTLLKSLAGLLPPDAGRISVFGGEAGSPAARKRTGYVAQEQALDPEMTGRETAAFFASLNGLGAAEAREAIPRLLRVFDLSDKADIAVAAYSGGMRQRLHILLEFLRRPEVVLLDEPTAGLDPAGRDAFWEYLRSHAEGGGAALLSLHELPDAAEHCSRVVLMSRGKIRAQGTPAELVAAEGAWLWKAQFSGPPRDGKALRESLSALPAMRAVDLGPAGVSLWSGTEPSGEKEILPLLKAAGVEVEGHSQRRPDLASAYRLLTGQDMQAEVDKRLGKGGGGGGKGGGGGGGGRGGGNRRGGPNAH